jgi:cytoskeletal protein CcmA (bactofilin family)
MTMFTRNDNKPAEASANTGAPGATASPLAPAAPVAEVKRPQASVQPLAPASPGGASVISKALKITGQLESSEDIRIDGEVDGDVRAVSVTVGSNAKVKGTVYGDTVELAGTVEGKIEAKKVILTGTAKMTGDVIHQDIRIESGAFIDGHCRPNYGKGAEVKSLPSKPAVVS